MPLRLPNEVGNIVLDQGRLRAYTVIGRLRSVQRLRLELFLVRICQNEAFRVLDPTLSHGLAMEKCVFPSVLGQSSPLNCLYP